MSDVKRLKDYTVVTIEQQVEFRNAALKVEKDYLALQAEDERLNNSVALLRGQLQNTVNHLDSCRRGYHSLERKILPCIESANKSLYESLHGLGQYANKVESDN